jgi:hypothetical protein
MSYSQELRDRLKAIKAAERQTKDTRAANEARHEAWGEYLDERVRDHAMAFYVNPDGAASSYPGEAS